MDAFALWLRGTEVSIWIRDWPWLWPLLETLHFVGMSMLIGVIGLLDVRLLGLLKNVPVGGLRRLLPWGIAGFVINLVTGVMFIVGAPDQYIKNPAFYLKVVFLLLAGANALLFEIRWGATVAAMGAIERTPSALKVAGAVSLVSWFMVLYWGRMLPFIGNAF